MQYAQANATTPPVRTPGQVALRRRVRADHVPGSPAAAAATAPLLGPRAPRHPASQAMHGVLRVLETLLQVPNSVQQGVEGGQGGRVKVPGSGKVAAPVLGMQQTGAGEGRGGEWRGGEWKMRVEREGRLSGVGGVQEGVRKQTRGRGWEVGGVLQ